MDTTTTLLTLKNAQLVITAVLLAGELTSSVHSAAQPIIDISIQQIILVNVI